MLLLLFLLDSSLLLWFVSCLRFPPRVSPRLSLALCALSAAGGGDVRLRLQLRQEEVAKCEAIIRRKVLELLESLRPPDDLMGGPSLAYGRD